MRQFSAIPVYRFCTCNQHPAYLGFYETKLKSAIIPTDITIRDIPDDIYEKLKR